MTVFSFKFHLSMNFSLYFFFFFNDPAPPEIYPLSLHDALPIYSEVIATCLNRKAECRHFRRSTGNRARQLLWRSVERTGEILHPRGETLPGDGSPDGTDRKSTRLNSSHGYISYAVFCLKKKTCS